MSGAKWWNDMASAAVREGHAPHSVGWYRSMRDQYRATFPDADQRSLDNMDSFVTFAESRVVASSGEAE